MKVIFHIGSRVDSHEEVLFSIIDYVLQIHFCVDFLILMTDALQIDTMFDAQ